MTTHPSRNELSTTAGHASVLPDEDLIERLAGEILANLRGGLQPPRGNHSAVKPTTQTTPAATPTPELPPPELEEFLPQNLEYPPSSSSLEGLRPESYGLPGEGELKLLLGGLGLDLRFSEACDPLTQAPSRYYFIPDKAAVAPAGNPLSDPAFTHEAFDVQAVRRDFPILAERVHGRPLIWLDNAATTQKPEVVIQRLADFYRRENSNIHRAAHALAGRATDAYEDARKTVARFLGASSAEEIVFLRGTTEAINLVAQSWGKQEIGAGDEILVSHLEHHANIVPWQQLAAETGARIRVIPVDDHGQLRLDEYQK
ncbi:aminotransferase class V-fold PLP-dependent enzyme, partial [Ectothiorhodospira lacustris]|uniref:aminotransferase class V-fold PLP-dependent enzyme n=1 Tax=Ectothiorhodospira lacustris TaxID=2899127 RepID=UPI001EE80CE4